MTYTLRSHITDFLTILADPELDDYKAAARSFNLEGFETVMLDAVDVLALPSPEGARTDAAKVIEYLQQYTKIVLARRDFAVETHELMEGLAAR